MSLRHLEQVHEHKCLDSQIRTEYCEEDRLHRHRVVDGNPAAQYTTWVHNTPSHRHRLPNGAWTRPRQDLNPVFDHEHAANPAGD